MLSRGIKIKYKAWRNKMSWLSDWINCDKNAINILWSLNKNYRFFSIFKYFFVHFKKYFDYNSQKNQRFTAKSLEKVGTMSLSVLCSLKTFLITKHKPWLNHQTKPQISSIISQNYAREERKSVKNGLDVKEL